MELNPLNFNQNTLITLRKPKLEDGEAIYQLIKASPPLDVNSSYLYFLQASHFADTCVLAEQQGKVVGFLSGYFVPNKPQALFVWQVAVSSTARGQGLAKKMLNQLMKHQQNHDISELICTISPSNSASKALFTSFAKTHGLTVNVTPFLSEQHFSGQNHEAEDEYCLKAPNQQNLMTFITHQD